VITRQALQGALRRARLRTGTEGIRGHAGYLVREVGGIPVIRWAHGPFRWSADHAAEKLQAALQACQDAGLGVRVEWHDGEWFIVGDEPAG
jgi:hypothetical protein